MDDRAPAPGRHASLRGRASECAVLDQLVSAVRRGEGRSLVLRGEAGIGKTALLEYLVESASDLTVLRAVGVESEMELAYAGLHQLCAPLLDRRPRLPAPQRQALETVFGLSSGAVPDRFLVALATLSLLSDVADERPLLCIVDDAQWLDQASALTLAFVARRLVADPVAIVFAARESAQELERLPELEVGGLVNGDARALLASALRLKLDARIRDRIIAETQGNPLALLELPRGLTPTELAGGFGVAGAGHLPARIEESFQRRLAMLSDDARRLLLLAAAEPVGDPPLLLRASTQLGIAVSAVDAETKTDGLLSIGKRVTFRHPLVRSAVYRAASAAERRAAHRALADATSRDVDPDRRVWHQAEAASRPDEEIAGELEQSAGRAQARGGLAATAAFLQRAVMLTQDPNKRAERALAAAQASLGAGAFDAARELLTTAEASALDEFQSVRVDLLRGRIAFASGAGARAPQLLLEAARRLERFDLELARETYLTAWGAAVVAGRIAGQGLLVEICHAIRALPPPGSPTLLDLYLDGLALLTTEGHAAAAPTLRLAAKALADIPAADVLRWGWMAAAASTAVWDFEGMLGIPERQLQLVRDAGGLAQLPIHLSASGVANAWMGDFATAASLLAEEESLAAATGSRFASYVALRLRALQGREAEALVAIQNALEHASAAGQGTAATAAHWATAVLYNGLARYEKAAQAAWQAASDTLIPWTSMYALPELVEAAARAGDTETASNALERLTATTQPSGNDFGLGIEARSRALLSDGAAADDLYREAIDRLSRTPLRPELARAQLLYGEWLRREDRRADAHDQLRAAHDLFTSIGMEAFGERAKIELLATGGKVRRPAIEMRDQLTAQEREIARLARDGMSNPEIGTRLFLSPRTIEWHLRNVYTKLGIGSRRQLAGALATSESGREGAQA